MRGLDVDSVSLLVWKVSAAEQVAIFGIWDSDGGNLFLSCDRKAVQKSLGMQSAKFGHKLRKIELVFYLKEALP